MSRTTLAVLITLILSSCAAMAQNSVPVDIIVCPEWAAKTWSDGVLDGNIHGRGSGQLAPNANATRAEAWAFAVAAAKQIWRDNSWWIVAVLIGLTFGLITGLIALAQIRRELNALRNQPSATPAINLTLSLPNGLWSGPLVSGVSATASPTVSAAGGTTSSAAEGGTGGTANQADNASNAGTRSATTTTETKTKNDYSVRTKGAAGGAHCPFGTMIEAPDFPAEPESDDEGRILYERPYDAREIVDTICVDLNGQEGTIPSGYVLLMIKEQKRVVENMLLNVPVAIYGKPPTDTPNSDRLDEPGTTSGGIPV